MKTGSPNHTEDFPFLFSHHSNSIRPTTPLSVPLHLYLCHYTISLFNTKLLFS